ncbi:MAG TPA: glycosyltransferase, partial [Candidatus Dormibacteraeota bacterium]|nr:glycosyltransferase [Candidatus Dormibacteraeota bacterium]
GLGRSVTIVGTDMSMSVHRALPRRIPLTYGTAELVERARSMRRGPVSLLVPPVDTDENAPGAADPAPFARAHGLDGEHLNIVVVSRLVDWMKLEGVRAAVDAVAGLAPSLPVRLAVVGDGDARAGLAGRADEVNAGLGVRAVAVTGPLADPRPAYAWADVVVGMGSSVLRGMAFAKPCVVVGERGFAEPVTPETVDQFLWRGFFGVGAGAGAAERLGAELRGLAGDPARRAGLGAWSRRLVVDRFGLAAGAAALDAQYREAVSSRPGRRDVVVDGGSTAVRLAASRALPGRVRELLRGGEVRR